MLKYGRFGLILIVISMLSCQVFMFPENWLVMLEVSIED